MIYRTLGKNNTGQVLVACPCVPIGFHLDMYELPSEATLFEVQGAYQRLYFLPSRRTIAIWCPKCYEKLEAPPAGLSGQPITQSREIEA